MELVQAKLHHFPKWKDSEKVLEVMTKTAEEWALIETDLRDRANDGREFQLKSKGSQAKIQRPGGSSK